MKDDTMELSTTEEKQRERIRDLESENAHLRLQLAIMSSTDPVTGLANRAGVVDSIEVALNRLPRMREPFAVVGVRFPQIAILDDEDLRVDAVRDLGALLAAGLRNVDRVGRIDDTTFIAILANIPADHVSTVTGRTREMLGSLVEVAGLPESTLKPGLCAVSVVDPETESNPMTLLDTVSTRLTDGSQDLLII
ncbi:MAG: GGDEF domain-containing protein [Actinomycetia bacterium]|nr:GGDEF domain-containing protein [Actinomycetes bacterium]MCP4960869.1 GGDEF domain-containing protein [Actinomycetes bacterium]